MNAGRLVIRRPAKTRCGRTPPFFPMLSSQKKIIITGTGRAGTTFLVQLLTELGLDTGYTPDTWRNDYFEHCNAGLEHEIEDPKSPSIVKSPELSGRLPAILARGTVEITHALIPIRDLDAATRSRVRVGGDGRTPGGLRDTRDPARQKSLLAENFHVLLHTLTTHEIPYTLLHFPRFATDADYAFKKLSFLAPGIPPETFANAFRRVARPELIHEFNSSIRVSSHNRDTHSHQVKRRRRRVRRILGWSALAGVLFWLLAFPPLQPSADALAEAGWESVAAAYAIGHEKSVFVGQARRLFRQNLAPIHIVSLESLRKSRPLLIDHRLRLEPVAAEPWHASSDSPSSD